MVYVKLPHGAPWDEWGSHKKDPRGATMGGREGHSTTTAPPVKSTSSVSAGEPIYTHVR